MKYNFEEWKFIALYSWKDGGSITMKYIDKIGQNKTIVIMQNVSKEYYEEISKIQGRVYVNNDIIDKRSNQEGSILKLLRKDIENQNTKLNEEILEEKIKWIKSKQYLEFEPVKLTMSEKRKQQLRNNKNPN